MIPDNLDYNAIVRESWRRSELSQKDMAAEMGVNFYTFRGWLQGADKFPAPKSAAVLALILYPETNYCPACEQELYLNLES